MPSRLFPVTGSIMKRSSPSFVVQHKRRSRTPKDEPASIWSDDVGRELRGMLRDTNETPAEEAASAPAKVAKKAKPAAPKRILEAREEPATVTAPEPEAEAPPARRGRPRKQRQEVLVPVEDQPEPVAAEVEAVEENEPTLLASGEDIAGDAEAEAAAPVEDVAEDDDAAEIDGMAEIEDGDDEDAELLEDAPQPVMADAATSAPAPAITRQRPSFSERRRAARKALPLADRWRWNLRY